MDESPTQLHQEAIRAALSSDWERALQLNEKIINLEPSNTDALNRIARAYFELGDISKSKKYYEATLEKDPYNQIASKFLKKIQAFNKKGSAKIITGRNDHHYSLTMSSDFFIEEPGKTKAVTLLKVAEPQRLSIICPGTPANLLLKNKVVAVTDDLGEYLGVLPDDLSRRLIRLIKGGNKYQALVKNIKPNSVTIIIREVFRSAKFKNQSSFLENLGGVHAFSSDHIIVPLDEAESPTIESDEEQSA